MHVEATRSEEDKMMISKQTVNDTKRVFAKCDTNKMHNFHLVYLFYSIHLSDVFRRVDIFKEQYINVSTQNC
jgi:hypothetical protein